MGVGLDLGLRLSRLCRESAPLTILSSSVCQKRCTCAWPPRIVIDFSINALRTCKRQAIAIPHKRGIVILVHIAYSPGTDAATSLQLVVGQPKLS